MNNTAIDRKLGHVTRELEGDLYHCVLGVKGVLSLSAEGVSCNVMFHHPYTSTVRSRYPNCPFLEGVQCNYDNLYISDFECLGDTFTRKVYDEVTRDCYNSYVPVTSELTREQWDALDELYLTIVLQNK